MKAPAVQWYWSDFLVDTMGWSCIEIGAYMRLLGYEWVNGCIPEDTKRQAMICKIDHGNYLKSVYPIAIGKFEFHDGGGYNRRLEEERLKQSAYSEKQREKGKIRAEKMWSGHVATAKKRLQPKHSSSSSSSSSINKKEIYKEKKPCKHPLTDDQFFEMLKSNEAYKELNVDIQKAKCEAWCLTNQKMFSRRRFINWLNRAEKPIVKMVEESPSLKEYYRKYPEAKNV
jgi:uncharacterized protein YdaU (DUF1376 family)